MEIRTKKRLRASVAGRFWGLLESRTGLRSAALASGVHQNRKRFCYGFFVGPVAAGWPWVWVRYLLAAGQDCLGDPQAIGGYGYDAASVACALAGWVEAGGVLAFEGLVIARDAQV